MFKRKRLITVIGIIFLALFVFADFIRGQYVVVILMYHSITPDADPKNRLAITAEAFERQMRFLRQARYNVIPLEEVANLIKNKKKIPSRTVAITLDDGYKNNYTYAFPILKKYNLPATIFVIVSEIGRLQNDRLDWGEIEEMLASGIVTIGSHCLGPQPLINIKSEKKIKKEIFGSKRALENRLGRRINAFSYPEGRFNDEIRQLVIEADYKLAVATSPGKKFADDDIFALKRLRISPTSNSLFVFWVESSGYYTFIKEHRDDD